MLDAINVLTQAKSLGSTKTLADVDAAIAAIDYPTLRANERPRYVAQLWDKVTPINGVAPEIILNEPNIDQVYLIYIDGKLVYLQKHDPAQSGFASMNTDEALAIANKQVDSMIEQTVDANALNTVLRQLL